MNRTVLAIPTLTLLLALAAGTAAPAEAQERWQLKLSGVYADTTGDGGGDSSLGGGLAIEYRPTPRLGIEIGGLTAELQDEARVDLFIASFVLESELRMTPILARLNLHLTPDRRADVYLGPVAGWVAMDDLSLGVRLAGEFLEEQVVGAVDFAVEDQFTWGAHAGVDVRLGARDSRSFLTAGVTWLDLPLELELPPPDPADDDNTIDFDPVGGDLDPLVVSVGYSYRF